MMSKKQNTYPAHREADVVLRDGSTAHVRPIKTDDEAPLLDFLKGLSSETVALRFFTGGANLEKVARWCSRIDYRDHFGLIATTGPSSSMCGHASYVRVAPERAEVALEVADAFQGHGIGTMLLGHLAEVATENGITEFEGHVLPQNHRMIDMFRGSGFPMTIHSEPGEVVIEFPTSLSPDALERFDRRDQLAAVAALQGFLSPRSVAVIGAGRARGTIGGEVFHNLIATAFEGPVYPVNPKADVVQSVVAYPSVRDVPGPVDLAIVVVPAPFVVPVARECADKGVRSLVVISAGFSEVGEEGTRLQHELLQVCRDTGMRLIGPNCMGIVNAAPDIRLNGTFVSVYPPHGRIGFLSQSGALGLAVMDHAATLGLGISSFVSIGNKADISGNDLIQYWEADEDTDLILLYLESFGNPRKFARIARRVGKRKPIIAVKSGRSPAGARATSSHTGAMLAASDVTVDALFQQTGVIRTDTLAEMFDVASLLANQPPPEGNRVAIITNAGGPGILCADACQAGGIHVPTLPDHVRAALAEFLPREAARDNPVDMIASASADDYRRAIETVTSWDGIDALIVIFIPPLLTRASEVARAIRAATENLPRPIPILSVFMSSQDGPGDVGNSRARIPTYTFPEDAARALARAVRYGMWRATPESHIPTFADVRRNEAASIVADALADELGWLTPDAVTRLLSCYGIPLIQQRDATSPKEAGRVARALGGPVALKAVAPGLLHKTEAGAVRLGLKGLAQVTEAATEMARRLGETEFIVQRMAPPGVEALVGVVGDPVFGSVVACGAGGTAVELLNDVQVRIAPLTEQDASEMIRSLRTYPLFQGYRGAVPTDVAALEDVLLRVSALVEAHPEIVEMDLNPVIVHASGAVVVDARVRVEPQKPRSPLGARRPL